MSAGEVVIVSLLAGLIGQVGVIAWWLGGRL